MCKDELIDLQSSTALYSTFISCNDDFSKFWCRLVEGFLMLTKRELEIILPFPTTYLCEDGFSSLMTMKTQQQSCLVAKDILVALSATASKFSELIRNKQVQKSH